MEKILFKFMRAKYSEVVTVGKIRGKQAEYIKFRDWRLEVDYKAEDLIVVTPTNNTVESTELFEAVLDAVLTGDTEYIDKLASAIYIGKNRDIKIKTTEGDIKITNVYYRADGTVGALLQLYAEGASEVSKSSMVALEYSKFIEILDKAGAF